MRISDGRAAETEPSSTRRAVELICLVLVLVTLGVYAGVLQHNFVNYDDFDYVLENPHVQGGLSPSGVIWAFTTGFASNWHPLTWLSHMLDCQIYGIDHPGGHHLTNLLFHAANSVLLFLLLRRMTGALWRSAVVAALFAWHPLHVESVAWIAERKDVLSTFFWLLTMMAYVRYVEEFNVGGPGRKKYYRLMLLLFALGLMSKPMLVTLPFVLLLADYWPLRRSAERGVRSAELPGEAKVRTVSWNKLIVEKLPMFALTVISSVVTFLVQQNSGAVLATQREPVTVRIGHALLAYVGYMRQMVWPSGLAVYYPLPKLVSVNEVVAAAMLLALLTAGAVALARWRRYVLFGWLWFLGTLVPVIGLVQVGSQAMADRYTYMPLVGLFIIFVWGLADLPGEGRFDMPNPAWAVALPILAACVLLTRNQLPYWKNSETLFHHDLDAAGDNFTAHFALAYVLDKAGQTVPAETEMNAALQLEPHSAKLFNLIGIHYARLGDLATADGAYRSALRSDPSFSDPHYNLGNLLAREGKLDEASAEYGQALRLKPDSPDAHNNLGAVLLRQNRLQDALAQYKAALRLLPDYPEAQFGMASVLLQLGHLDLAQIHYEEVLRLKPDFAGARSKLGLVLARQGSLQEAIPEFQTAIKQEPQNPEIYFNLAAAYAALNRLDDAVKTFGEVLRLKPGDVPARLRLTAIFLKQGDTNSAIQICRDTLRVKPDSTEAMRELAWLLATAAQPELRDGAEAVRLAEKAGEPTGPTQSAHPGALDAAYAEAGRFDEAVKTAEKVRQMALAAGQPSAADEAAKRLELYRAHKAYHE
jgi:tetratricopeptide (TPR) repeat protein